MEKSNNIKKVATPLFVLTAFIFFFSSCANYYYSPNDGDLVMLKEQHDGHISAASNLGGSDNKKVLNVQAGYIPIKHCRCFLTVTSVNETSELSRLGVENSNFNVGLILEIDTFFRDKIKKDDKINN